MSSLSSDYRRTDRDRARRGVAFAKAGEGGRCRASPMPGRRSRRRSLGAEAEFIKADVRKEDDVPASGRQTVAALAASMSR